jgi:squalene-hopene/tetraprenyl-beta-curcumene cyclase
MAAGLTESKAVERGIDFLLERQGEDGSWPEPEFTGTGFPGHFYINYHQYRVQFPLTALGRFRSARGSQV